MHDVVYYLYTTWRWITSYVQIEYRTVYTIFFCGGYVGISCVLPSSRNKPLFVKNTFHRFEDAILTYNKEIYPSRTPSDQRSANMYSTDRYIMNCGIYVCMYKRFPFGMFTSNLGGVASWKGEHRRPCTSVYTLPYPFSTVSYYRLCITTRPVMTFGARSNSSPGVLYSGGWYRTYPQNGWFFWGLLSVSPGYDVMRLITAPLDRNEFGCHTS